MVQGSVWLVEQLVTHRIITLDAARQSYQHMERNGRRLPWKLAYQRLDALQDELT
jgi:hypothetical protein